MDKFNYGENLRTIRVAKGISQDAMAHPLKISQKTYSRMEHHAAIPALDVVHATAKVLGIEPTALFPPLKETDQNAKPSPSKIPWQHTAKEIINTPIGVVLILVVLATFMPAAYGFAEGVCIYFNTTDETMFITQWSAALVMGIIILYWVQRIKRYKANKN